MILIVLSAFAPLASAGEVTRLQSPDGRSVARCERRAGDGWDTIFVTRNGRVRDVLPGDVSGKLGSPGVRGLMLGTWLNDSEVAFQYHCGTGCIGVYKVNVDTDAVTEIWTGSVDFDVFWPPLRDRAVVVVHLGGLMMLYADGHQPATVPGCKVSNSVTSGQMYLFDHWLPNGTQAVVRKTACADGGLEGGTKMTWDGERFHP